MKTFADVIHELIDIVLQGDTATEAHTIIDQASGPRTPAEEPAPAPAEEVPPTTDAAVTVPGADEAPEEAPPTPGG